MQLMSWDWDSELLHHISNGAGEDCTAGYIQHKPPQVLQQEGIKVGGIREETAAAKKKNIYIYICVNVPSTTCLRVRQ